MLKNFIALFVTSFVLSAISTIIQGINEYSGIYWIAFVIGGAAAAVGIAVVIACIPAGIYWLISHKKMPGFNLVIWILLPLFTMLSLIGNMS